MRAVVMRAFDFDDRKRINKGEQADGKRVIFGNYPVAFFTQFFHVLSNYSTPLGIIGSCLLILVGIYFLFFKKVKISSEGEQLLLFNRRDYARMFFAGSIINLLNPGIIVFWFTTATAFISYSLNSRLVIFSMALLIALGADVAKVILADKLRKKLTPKNIHRINKINGIILIGFGIALIWGLLVYAKHA